MEITSLQRVETLTPNEEEALQTTFGSSMLHFVVKESMYRDLPISFLMREAILTDNIDAFSIPAGVAVHFRISSIRRDREGCGAHADAFNSERWFRDDIKKLSICFLLSWHGCRNCIGRRYAMLEIKTFVAVILRRRYPFTQLEDGISVAIG